MSAQAQNLKIPKPDIRTKSKIKMNLRKAGERGYRTKFHGVDESQRNDNHYYCLCGKRFAKRRHLHRHIVFYKNGKKFSCPACDRLFHGHSEMKRHTKTAHAGMTFKSRRQQGCRQCGQLFPDMVHLTRHRKQVHNLKKGQLSSKRSPKLANDKVSHGVASYYSGDEGWLQRCLCGAQFKKREGLLHHLRIQLSTTSFQCHLCPSKVFRCAEYLRGHMRRMHAEVSDVNNGRQGRHEKSFIDAIIASQ